MKWYKVLFHDNLTWYNIISCCCLTRWSSPPLGRIELRHGGPQFIAISILFRHPGSAPAAQCTWHSCRDTLHLTLLDCHIQKALKWNPHRSYPPNHIVNGMDSTHVQHRAISNDNLMKGFMWNDFFIRFVSAAMPPREHNGERMEETVHLPYVAGVSERTDDHPIHWGDTRILQLASWTMELVIKEAICIQLTESLYFNCDSSCDIPDCWIAMYRKLRGGTRTGHIHPTALYSIHAQRRAVTNNTCRQALKQI